MPSAARITDPHTCPKVEPGPEPHDGGPVLSGEATVLIGYQPAARVGDQLSCRGPNDSIVYGESSVLIGHRRASRIGDGTAHGGVIVGGCPSVLIGTDAQVGAMLTDLPFVEDCDERRVDPDPDPEDPPS